MTERDRPTNLPGTEEKFNGAQLAVLRGLLLGVGILRQEDGWCSRSLDGVVRPLAVDDEDMLRLETAGLVRIEAADVGRLASLTGVGSDYIAAVNQGIWDRARERFGGRSSLSDKGEA
jgi:hypothetical protein